MAFRPRLLSSRPQFGHHDSHEPKWFAFTWSRPQYSVRSNAESRTGRLAGRDGQKLEEAQEAQAKAKAAADSTAKASLTKPSHILMDYTGTYEHPGYGKMEIDLKNDTLFVQTGLLGGFLEHKDYDTFNMYLIYQGEPNKDNAFPFQFVSNMTGDISGLKAPLSLHSTRSNSSELQRKMSFRWMI